MAMSPHFARCQPGKSVRKSVWVRVRAPRTSIMDKSSIGMKIRQRCFLYFLRPAKKCWLLDYESLACSQDWLWWIRVINRLSFLYYSQKHFLNLNLESSDKQIQSLCLTWRRLRVDYDLYKCRPVWKCAHFCYQYPPYCLADVSLQYKLSIVKLTEQ